MASRLRPAILQVMPRAARIVFPGLPHHVTQRGNRRNQVFFSDADYLIYRHWLREYAAKHDVEVLAYALMPNHVHLILVPGSSDSIYLALRTLHMRYAQRVNRHKDWVGHLWQGRYFACVLDEPHFWCAMRYVERNPVCALLAERCEDYAWSSASAHCGLSEDRVLTASPRWQREFRKVVNWRAWLAESDPSQVLDELRARTLKGQPFGSARFVESLERMTGRVLHPRPAGRPVVQRNRDASPISENRDASPIVASRLCVS